MICRVAAWGERAAARGAASTTSIVVLVGSGVGRRHHPRRQAARGRLGSLGRARATPRPSRRAAVRLRPARLPRGLRWRAQPAAWARDDLRIALAAARTPGSKHPAVGRKLLEMSASPKGHRRRDGARRARGRRVSRRLLEEAGNLLGVALANLVTTLESRAALARRRRPRRLAADDARGDRARSTRTPSKARAQGAQDLRAGAGRAGRRGRRGLLLARASLAQAA